MNPKVDLYFSNLKHWLAEMTELRRIVLECQLTEELKWGEPCYMDQGHNIVLIHGFKHYCALLFFKGALLKDPQDLLIQQTKNVQSARQIRFSNLQAILTLESTLKAYIQEAIDIEKAGLKVEKKKTSDYEVPVEFQQKLDTMPELKEAFARLTPGRQRGYLLHFASAKQAKTRKARVEENIPKILDGLGLDESR